MSTKIRMRRWVRGALPLVAMLAAGCGDSSTATDAGASDTGATPGDVTEMDVAAEDSGVPADTVALPVDVGCTGDSACPAGQVCMAGACVTGCNAAQACPSGQSCCGGMCVDPQTSLAHCGGCGTACTAASGTADCVAGRCTVTGCPGASASCDMMAANGCETDTATSLAHCGACGNACPTRANATSTCASGACGYTCAAGFGDCDGMADNGCETDTRVTVAHCGTCSTACSFANATAACAAGACALASCAGAYGDCDAMAANGCEVDTRVTVAHCGGCGMACAVPNATAACAAGACRVGMCSEGFADCDMMVANGCEVDVRTSAAHCGACGRACGAGQTCAAGACQYGTGSDGPLVAATDQVIGTVRAGAAGAAGSTTVTLSNVAGVFAAGQSVLLHQTQAAVGSVGHYEYARVASVAGATLTLTAPLRNAYLSDATSHAQVVRVLEYTAVTINAAATVTAPAWDGSSGGIMAFDATGRLSVAGAIDVTARGFRGNRRTCAVTPVYRCMRGVAGESERGRGAANIRSNQSGGGGGGAGQDCASGGGGGHATPGEPGAAGTFGVCAEANPIPPGGGGGTSGVASLSSAVLFGGAGGEGGADEDGSFPGGGGHGGGIVMVRASSVVLTGAGAVRANGGDGESGHQSDCAGGTGAGMGGGGGGGGGAVRLTALVSATVLSATAMPGPGVRADGGGGGYCGATSQDYAAGAGGNGRVSIVSPMVMGATFPAHTMD